uniref:Uncharacterized protein n=1 Tax=Anguilla anguilla TaxID=7936 RepID=A0A0E9QV45_ANGAN
MPSFVIDTRFTHICPKLE